MCVLSVILGGGERKERDPMDFDCACLYVGNPFLTCCIYFMILLGDFACLYDRHTCRRTTILCVSKERHRSRIAKNRVSPHPFLRRLNHNLSLSLSLSNTHTHTTQSTDAYVLATNARTPSSLPPRPLLQQHQKGPTSHHHHPQTMAQGQWKWCRIL